MITIIVDRGRVFMSETYHPRGVTPEKAETIADTLREAAEFARTNPKESGRWSL